MHKLLALDIETVSQGARANVYTDNAYYALGNVKDPAKVAAKLNEKKEEARNKHALHWGTGKVISVALVDVFGNDEPFVFATHNEKAILEDIEIKIEGCKLIGKSAKTFDYGFLVGRYLANNMPVPQVLRDWRRLLDMDDFFGRSAASGQRGKLALYAHGLGMNDKLMEGSAVAELYNKILELEMTGNKDLALTEWKKLEAYNLDDSEKVAEAARRYYGSIEEVM